jgi:murein DD-endopeptidase MepM/ murein hydrolase activator NlpD
MNDRSRHRRPRLAVALVAVVVVASPIMTGAPAANAAPRQAGAHRSVTQAAPTTTGPASDVPGAGDPSLKSQYDEVIGQESALLQRLSDARAASEQARTALADLEVKVTTTQAELADAEAALQRAEDEVARQDAATKRAEGRVAAAKLRLRRQAVASYVNGGEEGGKLAALLRARNGRQAGQALVFGNAVLGSTDQLIADLAGARAAQRKAEGAARRARQTSADQRDTVSQAADFLRGARDRQVTLVADVDRNLASEQTALIDVQGRKTLVESRINTMVQLSDGISGLLAGIQAGQPDFTPDKVVISNPIPSVHVGSGFGMRVHPILRIARLHPGDDLPAPSGTPIHAAADGLVVAAGARGGYGNVTVLDNGYSLGTVYAHQSRIDVAVGQLVKRGDVIGLVGSTGLSTGPHLHFETRIRGNPINPNGLIDFAAPVDYGTTATTTRNGG